MEHCITATNPSFWSGFGSIYTFHYCSMTIRPPIYVLWFSKKDCFVNRLSVQVGFHGGGRESISRYGPVSGTGKRAKNMGEMGRCKYWYKQNKSVFPGSFTHTLRVSHFHIVSFTVYHFLLIIVCPFASLYATTSAACFFQYPIIDHMLTKHWCYSCWRHIISSIGFALMWTHLC